METTLLTYFLLTIALIVSGLSGFLIGEKVQKRRTDQAINEIDKRYNDILRSYLVKANNEAVTEESSVLSTL